MHILFHRPTPWSSSVQCSTKTFAQVAAAEGHQVSYLQSPINLLHWLTGRGYYNVWKQGARHEHDRLYVSSGLSVIPELTRLGWYSNSLAKAFYKSSIPSIKKQIERSGFGEPDIIWTTVPGSSVLAKIFPNAKFVFHVIDYYPAFRGEGIKRLEAHDYKLADHVFCIGNSLKNYLVDELSIPGSKITVLGQGVSLSGYDQQLVEPNDLKDVPHPRAIWVGVLNKLDIGYLRVVANALTARGGALVLIGPERDAANRILEDMKDSGCNNVFFLGAKKSEEVSRYLLHSDLGLMLYDRDKQDVYRGQNPLKLYEYLAADLLVISTPHDEFEFLDPPIKIIANETEVGIAVRECLEHRRDTRSCRREFIESRDWTSIWKKAIQIIEQI